MDANGNLRAFHTADTLRRAGRDIVLCSAARSGGDKPGPKTYNRAKQEVTARDGLFYPGCYVDASLDIYAQDHPQYGRRINCGLLAVRFVLDGDSFGGGGGGSANDFADLPAFDDNDDLF